MTHKELVRRAARWLQNQGQCPVVLYEMEINGEIPDVIGWRGAGQMSILIECKTSREDFKRDLDKRCRQNDNSVGQYRYYFAEKDLIKPEEVPEGWGLLECSAYIKKRKDPVKRELTFKRLQLEMGLLYFAMHRQSRNITTLNDLLGSIFPLRGYVDGALALRGTDDLPDWDQLIGMSVAEARAFSHQYGYYLNLKEDNNPNPFHIFSLNAKAEGDIITEISPHAG